METLSRAWEWLGGRFLNRPIAVIGVVVGALIFGGLMGYLLVNQDRNTSRIQRVQEVLCSGPDPVVTEQQKRNCQDLLDRLLEHPTHQQADRLKQILKEGQ